jgi:hypothetical protein
MTTGKVDVWTYETVDRGGIHQKSIYRTTLDEAWCRKVLSALAPQLAKLKIGRCIPPSSPTIQLVFFEQYNSGTLASKRNEWVLRKYKAWLRGPVIAIPANIK